MWKEKKEIERKILATTKKEAPKDTKKAKKVTKKQEKKQEKEKKVPKESDIEVESEANSADDAPMEEEINPLTYANRVEYVETESFSLTPVTEAKKAEKKEKNKKNKKQGGILVNKTEVPAVAATNTTAPEINHFEETQPKDVIEIARTQKEEESKQKNVKEGKKKKQQQNEAKVVEQPAKSTPPVSPKNAVAKEVVDAPVVVAPVAAKPANSVTVQQKEKLNKKKKNEMITKQLQLAEIQDDTNVQAFLRILGKADLPRNEIQILIDYLLNKQQDTLTKDPSEWNDPSDPLQKLKKQLQDKEMQLKAEQEATAAIHAKLKELRTELNTERSQANASVKILHDELNNKKLEQKNLQQSVSEI
jgi:hypothetical protein